MTTFTSTLRATLAALCLAALGCNSSLGDATDGGTETGGSTGGNSSNPTSGSDDFWPCSASKACPDGQFCFNGVCAIGCLSDKDCADNQFCATDDDMLCHNKQVPTCPDTPCVEGQVCVNGFCSTPPPDTQCDPTTLPDGCESNALCIEHEEGKAECYTFPYCSQDGTCPVGTEGAVCNDGLAQGKDKICLIGLCTADTHCPADWNCVKFEANGVIGYCSNGGFGELCDSNDQCVSGVCMLPPIPGEPGFCA